MKKIIFLFTVGLLISCVVLAQPKQKIIYDVTDTVQYNSVLQKCATTLNETPEAEIEVVCYENGLYMLVKTTAPGERITALKSKGSISFKACANTMKQFGVKQSDLLPVAEIVPDGVLEISKKKADGWVYLSGSQIIINKWSATDRSEFINSCVAEAKKGISEDKAKSYCQCMLALIEGKFPDPADAVKLSSADLESPEWKAAIKACLQ